MEKVRLSHMNSLLPLPNRTSTFLQFNHPISFPNFPSPNPNPNPKPVRLFRRPNCSISDGTVPSSVAATDASLTVKKKAAEVSPELKGTSIFLVGMKSSLKTSLGKLLADSLRYYYFDSDSLVEEAVGGAAAAKLFRESDDKGFYESETEVLKQLSSMGRLVVCAGNGAVTSSTNLYGFITAVVKDELSVLYDKYRDGYATADATISVQRIASRLDCDNLDEVTREDVALEALKEIEKLTRVKKMMEEAARPF